jgi:hypothetical protein
MLFFLSFFLQQAIAQTKPLPDILFLAQNSFGGYGRLSPSSDGRYHLLDGRINTYVVDGNSIRLMRPDEGGGSMANPRKLAILEGKIFSASAYGQINQLDPVTGALLAKFNYTDFAFGGSGAEPALYSSAKALLVMEGQQIIALDSSLKKMGVTKLDATPKHVRLSSDFIQDGERLFSLAVDNPNTYTSCVDQCNFPTVIRQTTIDFSQPNAITAKTHEQEIKEQEYFAHKAVDGSARAWLLAKQKIGKPGITFQWRLFDSLAKVEAELSLPEDHSIEAITKTNPFWLVLKTKTEHKLARIQWDGKKLSLTSLPLPWLKGTSFSFKIAEKAGLLYLTANHQLAVYDSSKAIPSLLLQQDFLNPANGSGQLQFADLFIADLPAASFRIDRERLISTLKKDYWDDKDQLAIAAEVEKLAAKDTWAIPIFTELLKNRNQSYRGGIQYSVKALEKFGPAAESAMPALLYATMEGSAIRGDAMNAVIPAIKAIDPSGKIVRALLPECIKKTYVCEHVGKQILKEIAK